jgi:hypothetical protein
MYCIGDAVVMTYETKMNYLSSRQFPSVQNMNPYYNIIIRMKEKVLRTLCVVSFLCELNESVKIILQRKSLRVKLYGNFLKHIIYLRFKKRKK